jgi:DNA uptake protein ComE-like DNA-binding protein
MINRGKRVNIMKKWFKWCLIGFGFGFLLLISPLTIAKSRKDDHDAYRSSRSGTHASSRTHESICLNRADTQTLQRIVHITPNRALEIISVREERPFSSVDELLRIKGIGPARLEAIKREGRANITN